MPVSPAGVADLPYNAEDRLVRVDLGLEHLRVWVPERHDLALSKTVRGYQHDLDTIEQMHRAQALDAETILRRFENEMNHVVGDERIVKANFAALVERLFGQEKADQVAAGLNVAAPRPQRKR